MPYKNGPNGTHRLYSSTTGRYVKEQYNIEEHKRKKTPKEKAEERIRNLNIRAEKSKDPYIKDVYYALMNNCYGCIKIINGCFYDKAIHNTRELDIVTKNQIIEVKSGKGKHKLKQFLAQKRIARRRKIK